MRPEFYKYKINQCKNTFCNPKCKGLNRRLQYTRRIKDGWLLPEYSPEIQKILSKKHAMSGCNHDFYADKLGRRKCARK